MKKTKSLMVFMLSLALLLGLTCKSYAHTVLYDKDLTTVQVGDKISLACVPDAGYILDAYYWFDTGGNKHRIEGNVFTVTDNYVKDKEFDAEFIPAEERTIDSYRIKMIERVAELLCMTPEETNDFKKFIATLPDHYEYLNGSKLLYDLIRPLYKELYSADYENETADKDSIKEYIDD